MSALLPLAAMVLLCAIAWSASLERRAVHWRSVAAALALQVAIGALVLYVPEGRAALERLSVAVTGVLAYARAGIDFVFGAVAGEGLGFVFAFEVLPVIIFFSALVSALYHLGIMGWVIRIIGGALQRLLGTGRAESLAAASNIFVSQTEAPLVVRPYLARMTRSELFAVMVGGMATVAGSVLAGYVALGVEMRYLLAASFMAAPGGLLMAKLLVPETERARAVAEHHAQPQREPHVNVIDAAAAGAASGLALAVNIGATLLAFVGLIALLNGLLGWCGQWLGLDGLTLQGLLGALFRPLAFVLGVPWPEAATDGSLIGQKLVLNEFVAYASYYEVRGQLGAHSQAVVSFALCGFANFSSIAVLLGGLGTLVPARRGEVAALGMRAVAGGFLANLMSAAIASLFLALR